MGREWEGDLSKEANWAAQDACGERVPVPGDGTVLWRGGGGGPEVGEKAYRENKQVGRVLQTADIETVGEYSFISSTLKVFAWWLAVGLVCIRAYAFNNCQQLELKPGKREHAFLPPGVKEVGGGAFYGAFGDKHRGEVVLVGRSMVVSGSAFQATGLKIEVVDDDVYAAKFADYWREEHEAEVGWRRTRGTRPFPPLSPSLRHPPAPPRSPYPIAAGRRPGERLARGTGGRRLRDERARAVCLHPNPPSLPSRSPLFPRPPHRPRSTTPRSRLRAPNPPPSRGAVLALGRAGAPPPARQTPRQLCSPLPACASSRRLVRASAEKLHCQSSPPRQTVSPS